jgi:hypothetical protein
VNEDDASRFNLRDSWEVRVTCSPHALGFKVPRRVGAASHAIERVVDGCEDHPCVAEEGPVLSQGMT